MEPYKNQERKKCIYHNIEYVKHKLQKICFVNPDKFLKTNYTQNIKHTKCKLKQKTFCDPKYTKLNLEGYQVNINGIE